MRRSGGLLLILLLAVFLPSCGDDSPTDAPPTTSTTGATQPPNTPEGYVVIYERDNFEGEGFLLRTSMPDLDDIPGPCNPGGNWDDCVSSIRLVGGWTARLYDRDDFEGDSLDVVTDIADLDSFQGCDLADWDNCASSISVFSPAANPDQR